MADERNLLPTSILDSIREKSTNPQEFLYESLLWRGFLVDRDEKGGLSLYRGSHEDDLAMEDKTPSVGIFWFFRGEIIADAIPVTQGDECGKFVNHPLSHHDFWNAPQAAPWPSRTSQISFQASSSARSGPSVPNVAIPIAQVTRGPRLAKSATRRRPLLGWCRPIGEHFFENMHADRLVLRGFLPWHTACDILPRRVNHIAVRLV